MRAERKDIVIVGSGPAGVSTALTLERIAPEAAGKTVVLEARRHPREKVCAGCLTGRAMKLFNGLGIDITVPHVPISRARFRTAWGDLNARTDSLYGAVVRRDEFDASVAKLLREKEIEFREGVLVRSIEHKGGRVLVNTSEGSISAKAVVGADGAGSVVRKFFNGISKTTLLVQAELPIDNSHPSHSEGRIEFDFRKVPEGRRGYRWTFPFVRNGEPHVNVGICEWNEGKAADLKDELKRYMDSEALEHKGADFRFFPERPFQPGAIFSAPGIVLAGESAGIDPFLGEGLSYSVEYGMLAAEAVAMAFKNNDFSFSGYTAEVGRSKLGKTLRILHLLAKHFYGPFHERLVRAGLMDEQVSKNVGDFLAGNIKPSVSLVARIAYRLARNILI